MQRTWIGVALALVVALTGCGKPAAPAPVAKAAAPKPAAVPLEGADHLTAQPSESIATNVADPTCPTCQHADAESADVPPKPPLDPVFRDDLKLTINLACQVMEDGVSILEKHVKDPPSAKDALLAYREKHKEHLAELAIKTKDMVTRLKGLGYDADVPEEVRPEYQARMDKVMARLEVVRSAYAKQKDVLEAFGPFLRIGE